MRSLFPNQTWLQRGALMSALLLSTAFGARADQYTAVPNSDVLYQNLSVVERNGWLNSASRTPNAQQKPSTRYELALQTAGAIFLVSARLEADQNWVQTVSPSGFEALYALTTTLRPELQKLGVDVSKSLQLLNRMIAETSRDTSASTRSLNRADEDRVLSGKTRALPLPSRFNTRLFNGGVALGLGRDFSLRAGVSAVSEQPGLGSLTLRESQLPLGAGSSVVGGLDWTPRNGLTVSTNVENIRGATESIGTRFSGDVGVSAFNNRVSLVANLSRLKLENVEDASTLAGVNVGVGVSETVSLNVLYQRLFSTPSPSRSDQVVAGGVSIKF